MPRKKTRRKRIAKAIGKAAPRRKLKKVIKALPKKPVKAKPKKIIAPSPKKVRKKPAIKRTASRAKSVPPKRVKPAASKQRKRTIVRKPVRKVQAKRAVLKPVKKKAIKPAPKKRLILKRKPAVKKVAKKKVIRVPKKQIKTVAKKLAKREQKRIKTRLSKKPVKAKPKRKPTRKVTAAKRKAMAAVKKKGGVLEDIIYFEFSGFIHRVYDIGDYDPETFEVDPALIEDIIKREILEGKPGIFFGTVKGINDDGLTLERNTHSLPTQVGYGPLMSQRIAEIIELYELVGIIKITLTFLPERQWYDNTTKGERKTIRRVRRRGH